MQWIIVVTVEILVLIAVALTPPSNPLLAACQSVLTFLFSLEAILAFVLLLYHLAMRQP